MDSNRTVGAILLTNVLNALVEETQRAEQRLVGMSTHKNRSGRWGVVPASEHQEILVALASLIRAHRYEIATILIEHELKRSH